MSRSSIRYVDKTYIYGQQAVTAPVSNPVVYGKFPKHAVNRAPVEKLNKFLSMVLMLLVMVSVVSYYFVSDGEKRMNSLAREIVTLTNENIELQNKLDNMNSFNRVDSVVYGNKSALNTAKKVIEIPAVKLATAPELPKTVANYKWSIGY